MAVWLQKQKKNELLSLSSEAGLAPDSDSKRADLIETLDRHLQSNGARLSQLSVFEPYYASRRTPFKPKSSVPPTAAPSTAAHTAIPESAPIEDEIVVKSATKPRKRTTKVKEETEPKSDSDAGGSRNSAASVAQVVIDAVSPSVPAAARRTETPGPSHSRRRSTIPGPASPSAIADEVEYQSARLSASTSALWTSTGVPGFFTSIRESCSSVAGVQIAILLLEAYALQLEVLPKQYVADTPAITLIAPSIKQVVGADGILHAVQASHGLRIPSFPIKATDFFMVLTAHFWRATGLWLLTSVFLPLLAAWFFNLTRTHPGNPRSSSSTALVHTSPRAAAVRYKADPLTYNIAKALLWWAVYGCGNTFGFVRPDAIERVNGAMFGGWQGVIVGTVVGGTVALYGSVLQGAAR